MYDEPRRRGKGSCGVRAPIRVSHFCPGAPSLQTPGPSRPPRAGSLALHRRVVHPEVAAPAPERVKSRGSKFQEVEGTVVGPLGIRTQLR